MESREWRKNNLSGEELDQIEGQYLNLASYSNKLIRADKKTKKKNIITAIAILAFMVFLFVFTLYNVGVFDRQI